MAAEWYYTASGQQSGPVELYALQQMLGSGTLTGDDLVYGPGMTEWTRAGLVPALSAHGGEHAASMLGYQGVETAMTGLSVVAMNMLRQTKPWVRFMAITMFILAGIMVLGGLLMIAAGAMMGGRSSAAMPPALGALYVFMAAIYAIPAVLLNRYASSIANLMRSQRMTDVEQALGAQKSFWKFVGIMMIVVIVMYVLGIAGAIIFAVMR